MQCRHGFGVSGWLAGWLADWLLAAGQLINVAKKGRGRNTTLFGFLRWAPQSAQGSTLFLSLLDLARRGRRRRSSRRKKKGGGGRRSQTGKDCRTRFVSAWTPRCVRPVTGTQLSTSPFLGEEGRHAFRLRYLFFKPAKQKREEDRGPGHAAVLQPLTAADYDAGCRCSGICRLILYLFFFFFCNVVCSHSITDKCKRHTGEIERAEPSTGSRCKAGRTELAKDRQVFPFPTQGSPCQAGGPERGRKEEAETKGWRFMTMGNQIYPGELVRYRVPTLLSSRKGWGPDELCRVKPGAFFFLLCEGEAQV